MSRGKRSVMVASIFLTLLALVLSFVVSCSKAPSVLTVFAAAGAKTPLDEIAQEFEDKYGITVEINYGGGGEVLNQMVLSKSGDIYVAPEQSFMQTAAAKQAIDPATIQNIAYMVPVIAVKKGNPLHISTLNDLGRPGVRVVVGRAETTLLGKLSPQIFEKAGLSDAIGKNIVTTASDCQSMLTMLVMGSADAAINWNFFGTSAGDKIDVIFLQPEQVTGIGEVQIAASSYSHNGKVAQQFIDFITSATGKEVFKKFGYFIDAGEVSKYWH
jgi:molybdate transport system substrate-binding protein